jgi:hypothetical protein
VKDSGKARAVKSWTIELAVRDCPIAELSQTVAAVLRASDPVVAGFDGDAVVSVTVWAADMKSALLIGGQRIARLLEHLAPDARVTIPVHELDG